MTRPFHHPHLRLESLRREADEPATAAPAHRAMTDADRAAAARLTAQSLDKTANRRKAALAIPCPTCGTAAGAWCVGSEEAVVRGMCAARLEKPDDLAVRAAGVRNRSEAERAEDERIQRNVERDQRWRQRVQQSHIRTPRAKRGLRR